MRSRDFTDFKISKKIGNLHKETVFLNKLHSLNKFVIEDRTFFDILQTNPLPKLYQHVKRFQDFLIEKVQKWK